MIVHKFGGTSVGTPERIANVAGIIAARQRDELERGAGRGSMSPHPTEAAPGTIVVVSALSKVTDALVDGARAAAEGRDHVYREIRATLLARHLQAVEALLPPGPARLELGGWIEDRLHELERLYRSIAILGELTVRGGDAVASFGEQLSARILAAALQQRGLRAQAVSATELIVTDDRFGHAQPLLEPTRQRLEEHLRPLLRKETIPVVTGYIAATLQGVTTPLGRGGSDYTAAIIGAALTAAEVWIWSDVDGILTADPSIVPEALTLAELSYAEAAELACYGADVLHPKTIRPVIDARIPLRLLNSFRPAHPGTAITATPPEGRQVWPAIISTSGLSLIGLGRLDDGWSLPLAARALSALGAAGVEVAMFSQSFSEPSLNLVVRAPNQAHCLRLLQREFGSDPDCPGTAGTSPGAAPRPEPGGPGDGRFHLGVAEEVATVSVVGLPANGDCGIVSRALAALGGHGTRVIAVAQAGKGNGVSFCIPESQVEDAVRHLHRELGPGGRHD